MDCTLCNSPSKLLAKANQKEYYQCPNCFAICMHPTYFLNWEAEKLRYEKHNNDVNDPNYQNFVGPIVDTILEKFTETDKGLDFGSGTGPVINKLLGDNHYNISTYDPIFDPAKEKLRVNYDYIACCEVVEHFHHPYREFKLLKSLLKEGGSLICMTEVYNETLDFENWYYKNDPTHVIFYHAKTFEWIKEHFNFSKLQVSRRLIVFQNK